MTANTRTILFLDDWPILAQQGIDRRWFSAESWPGAQPWHDPLLAYSAVTSVMRTPTTCGWRMWGVGMTLLDKGDEGSNLTTYASPDGLDWRPVSCWKSAATICGHARHWSWRTWRSAASWRSVLILVRPDTIIRWHSKGFRW